MNLCSEMRAARGTGSGVLPNANEIIAIFSTSARNDVLRSFVDRIVALAIKMGSLEQRATAASVY
jgi:hypothetical protein